ncbi:MAG: hypothetical protein KF716_25300 [Anaerolineae bacterium]|nr:hypothetical protein [Anaerolineae bacterium]
MTKFSRVVTRLVMIAALSVWLARALGYVGAPMSDGYRELAAQLHVEGDVVCWNALCPGKTLFDEAKRSSANFPVVFSDNFGFEIQYSTQINVQVANDGGTDLTPISVVSLRFAPDYLTLGEAVLWAGDPQSVDRSTRIQLPWQKGMCFPTGVSAFFRGTTHRIQTTLPIIAMVLQEPTRDSYCSSAEYVRWQGFAKRPFED